MYRGFTIDEVPVIGQYVVICKGHATAIVDGIIYDTFDRSKVSCMIPLIPVRGMAEGPMECGCILVPN